LIQLRESRISQPDQATRTLLRVIARDPKAVKRILKVS
jgi:DNA-binding transcriptional regulator YiaG